MKIFQFPVAPNDVLEFVTNDGTIVRGEVSFITFFGDESYATICGNDVFMKKCQTCNFKNVKKKKCKYYTNDNCIFSPYDIEEIHADEIGRGKKYKIVGDSWRCKY